MRNSGMGESMVGESGAGPGCWFVGGGASGLGESQ